VAEELFDAPPLAPPYGRNPSGERSHGEMGFSLLSSIPRRRGCSLADEEKRYGMSLLPVDVCFCFFSGILDGR